MEIKSNLLERLDDTFHFIGKHFLGFFKYSFILSLTSIVGYLFILLYLVGGFYIYSNYGHIDYLVMGFVGLKIFWGLIGLFINLGFINGLLKYIKNNFNNEEITINESIAYGFKNIGKILKVYVFQFFYIFTIPVIIFFIFSGLYFYNLANPLNISNFYLITVTAITSIITLIYIIFRGTRANFCIYNSIEYDSFNKENFKFNLKTTKKHFWRIFFNMAIIGIISITIYFVLIIISNIIFGFSDIFNASQEYTKYFSNLTQNDYQGFISAFNEIKNNGLNIKILDLLNISGLVDLLILNLTVILATIFEYLLFRTLTFEYTQKVEGYSHIEEIENTTKLTQEKEETV